MTHPNVRTGKTEPAPLAVHDPSLPLPTRAAAAAPPTVASLTIEDARAAANEEEAATPDALRNPLWVITRGTACMFGAMAAVIALGWPWRNPKNSRFQST
jgi:hypothetical protein